MEPQTQVPAIMQKNEMEYVPFGADTKIKLTLKIVREMIAIPTRLKKLPTDTECMRFMMLCRARKLNPFEGDCFLQGYDGSDGPQFSLITAHQAFLKRAEVNPEYDGMTSGVIVKDENDSIVEREGDFLYPGDLLLGGWARVYFKNRKMSTYRRLNLSTFDQGFGRWKKDKAGMIVKCAEADALRSSFPTMLGGLYSEAESTAVIDINPSAVKSPVTGFRTATQPRIVEHVEAPTQTQPEADPIEAQSPAQEAVTQSPEPEPAPEPAPDDGDLGPQEPFKANPAETDELQSVRLLMHRAGVKESQVIAWCKKNSMAKDNQNALGELSTAKLKTILSAWTNKLAEIKAILA